GVRRKASMTACMVNAVLPAPGAPPSRATVPGPISMRANSPVPTGKSTGGLPESTSSRQPASASAAQTKEASGTAGPLSTVFQPALDLPTHVARRQSRIEGGFRQQGMGEGGRTAELGEVRGRAEKQAVPVARLGAVADEVERRPVQ